MKIIILGAGQVGTTVADNLSSEANDITVVDQDPNLLHALQDPALYDHPCTGFEVLETHISWILLTGPYAYKIKKPVDLGFLDFSTLEKRRQYCRQEVVLNRRLSDGVYIGVVPIARQNGDYALNGTGETVEVAGHTIRVAAAGRRRIRRLEVYRGGKP